MYKIIGTDKKEYGPVTAAQLHQWISEGRANAQSLVQAVGSADWNPLGAYPEFAAALRVHAEPPPALEPVTPTDEDWLSQVLARKPQLLVGECLSSALTLLLNNFFLLTSCALLVWIIGTICQVNFLSGIVFWVLSGALYGGLYLVFIKRIRGEPASVGDTFSGFRLSFAQLLLAGCITSFVTYLGFFFCLLPGIFLVIVWILTLPLIADRRLEFWSAMELSRKIVMRVWFPMFALVVLAYLPSLILTFVVQIKIFYPIFVSVSDAFSQGNLKPEEMQALMSQAVDKNANLIWAAKIVQFLNMPFALAAVMYGYENLFGTRKA